MQSSIGSRLREERNRLNLIQTEAAKAAGVSYVSYQSYEKGERFPNAESLYGLFLVGFDVLYIVTGSRNNNTLSNTQTAVLEQFGQIDERLHPAVLTSLQALAATKL